MSLIDLLADLGIQMINSDGTSISLKDILKELSLQWDGLDKETKNNIDRTLEEEFDKFLNRPLLNSNYNGLLVESSTTTCPNLDGFKEFSKWETQNNL